ncbi:Ras subfamily protein [Acanthamoeba castellanii str. Neff]|uniref:Ras subfamily protein n=1 Tax=Acanthamoeba castellanii (strain ATCC 30010 / Neff) TaxID=1257118 RepID=L8H7I8_ACACF|nr:Ras subfamily protein [Acanthamoeba castellanii str. Neff]ELR21197.1 Ras subfamily protein [Acanthamoeba castellanii str. Neff]
MRVLGDQRSGRAIGGPLHFCVQYGLEGKLRRVQVYTREADDHTPRPRATEGHDGPIAHGVVWHLITSCTCRATSQFLNSEFDVARRLPLMIVGYHKSDKIRQVPTSEGKRYSEYYKCAFKEVRQDDPVGVEECIRDMLAEEYGLIASQKSAVATIEREAVADVSSLTEYEIAVMGDLFVGKTCLIRKLISNTFAPRYVSTGEEHKQKYRLGLDGKSYILRLTDTSGMIPLDSLTKEYLLPMQGFILVYSVTSRGSFDRLTELYPLIHKHKTETKLPHVIVIVGNKADEHFGRQVSFEEGSQLARQLGSAFFVELSAKEENVEEPFAQCVRYLLAHEASAAPLSQSQGEMEKAGSLQMMEKRRWRSRNFSVREGTLSFTSNISIGATKGTFPLTPGVAVKEHPADVKIGFPFEISSTDFGEIWLLAASTSEERSAWVASIRLNASKGTKAEESFGASRSDEHELRKHTTLPADIPSPAGLPPISHSIMEFMDSSSKGSHTPTYTTNPIWRSHELGMFASPSTVSGSPLSKKALGDKVTSLWRRDTKVAKKNKKDDRKHS